MRRFPVRIVEVFKSKTSLAKSSIILLLIIGFVATSLNRHVIENLCVTPLNVINNMQIYRLGSFFLFEPNIILLLNHIICIHLVFTILLPSWDVVELIKFGMMANVLTAVSCVLVFLIVYLITGFEKVYFTSQMAIRGMTGFDGAIFAAVIQNMPDTVLFRSPAGRFKNTHVPFVWLIGALILVLLDLINLVYIPMFCLGFYSSWCYLRFFQHHPNNTKGDSSVSFGFSSFFPSILQPPVEKASKCSYQCLIRLKICKPVIRTFDVKTLQNVTTTGAVSAAESVDQERRKQKALKDLSDRLAKTKESDLMPWEDEQQAATSAARISDPSAVVVDPVQIKEDMEKSATSSTPKSSDLLISIERNEPAT